ncbi:hypothetical protein TPHA_0O00720 [Tetrapisispora phaffii CBS 4417]|uniref:RRM domain-containing protein n=1 Tax=Tetrapisispora phaffii (strain ATCC 24235 / CBS 4417 / NBRC 1672 / NRRL Y-8282 / UCD 70-5) TaxID=1071381 RepID=G8C1L3_TETPH|nr:hypothetical protein TPHA_0O00720 [Tetrapisispora phaffii CBS 4417]CCE66041.1 hypothetical protein TPHA_0O00720 [Tetrapisispora phaffii CBS 4417]
MSDVEYNERRRSRSRSPASRYENSDRDNRRGYYSNDARGSSYRRPVRGYNESRYGDAYSSRRGNSRRTDGRVMRYDDRYESSRYDNGYSDHRGRRNDRYPSGGRGGGRRGGREDRGFRSDDRRSRGYQGGRARGDYGPRLDKDLDSSYEEKVNRNYINSIFVGNLTYDCTPEDLRQLFESIGEVVRADIITSRGHHRGMGTVEFTNPSDVDEAIKEFDGTFFMERQIFVRQDNPPPEESRREKREREPVDFRTNGRNKRDDRATLENNFNGYEILISNLPYSINWQALKDMFKECGTVLRADVDLDEHGYSQGTGVVLMADKEAMERSISKYDGYNIEGNVLEIREGNNNDIKETEDGNEPVSMHTKNENDGENNDKIEDTKSSTKAFLEGVVGGGEKSTLVYCSNLPFSTARSDLYDLFETIGKLKNAELNQDASGAPTGIAVIEYENIDDAEICIDRLNNYNYGGCDLDISYGKRQ